MKKLMTLAFLLLFSASTFAASTATHIKVTVNGLVCDFCAVSMKKVFMKKDTVAAVAVNLTTKIVEIDLKPGKALSDDEIKKGITDAGYAVISIKRD